MLGMGYGFNEDVSFSTSDTNPTMLIKANEEDMHFLMNWYAIYVETGEEEIVQKCLQRYLFEEISCSLVPKRIVPERRYGQFIHVSKILFPGYVLIRAEMNDELYYSICKIPKIYRILKGGGADEYYTKINEEEMEILLKLLGDKGVIESSKVILENSKVIVQAGALKGMEGIVRKVNIRKKRAKIGIILLGIEKIFEVSVELVEPVLDTPQSHRARGGGSLHSTF